MGLPGKSEGVVFSPVPCEVVCYEPERVGVAFLREAVEKPNPIQQDLQQVCQAAESLDRLLEQALSYVEKVLVSTHFGDDPLPQDHIPNAPPLLLYNWQAGESLPSRANVYMYICILGNALHTVLLYVSCNFADYFGSSTSILS